MIIIICYLPKAIHLCNHILNYEAPFILILLDTLGNCLQGIFLSLIFFSSSYLREAIRMTFRSIFSSKQSQNENSSNINNSLDLADDEIYMSMNLRKNLIEENNEEEVN